MMDPIIIPIVGMAIPIVIVPVALGIKYARRERELEHAERMKALELGRTLPQDEPLWSPGRLCLAIGVGVPIGVFGFAWLASGGEGIKRSVAVDLGRDRGPRRRGLRLASDPPPPHSARASERSAGGLRGQVSHRRRCLRRGGPPGLIPPRPPRRRPESQQRLQRDVEPGGDDRQAWKSVIRPAVRSVGPSRRRTSGRASTSPSAARAVKAQVARPVDAGSASSGSSRRRGRSSGAAGGRAADTGPGSARRSASARRNSRRDRSGSETGASSR